MSNLNMFLEKCWGRSEGLGVSNYYLLEVSWFLIRLDNRQLICHSPNNPLSHRWREGVGKARAGTQTLWGLGQMFFLGHSTLNLEHAPRYYLFHTLSHWALFAFQLSVGPPPPTGRWRQELSLTHHIMWASTWQFLEQGKLLGGDRYVLSWNFRFHLAQLLREWSPAPLTWASSWHSVRAIISS